jgi:hypothetical protein
MNTTSKQGLIALNIALLAVLSAVSLVPTTDAQVSSNDTYIAVPGTLNGFQPGVVYIVSTGNRAVLATAYDRNKKEIVIMASRSISRDAQGISKE